MKFHVYESGLFRVLLSFIILCFSATFLCASQLHHLVLLSIFAFFLPALIALLLGLNR